MRKILIAAAAVLVEFNPDALMPLGSRRQEEGLARELLAGCTMIGMEGAGSLWMLRDDVRVAALRRLGSRKAMLAALEANAPRAPNRMQATLEAYIKTHADVLDGKVRVDIDGREVRSVVEHQVNRALSGSRCEHQSRRVEELGD